MPVHTSEIKHRLGRAEAIARIKANAGLMRGYSDLKGSWEGNVFTFTTTMQGFAMKGVVHVEEDHLKLEGEMASHAPMFSTWLPRMATMALLPPAPTVGGDMDALVRPAAAADAGPAVLFLHIPKAGGHTLTEYIVAQCSSGQYQEGAGLFSGGIVTLTYGFFREGDVGVPAYLRPLLRRPDLRAVSGHFTFGLHQNVTRPSTYITVLRDPVDRVLSMYYFLELHKQMTVEEFAANPPFREIDNDQTRRIAGVHPGLGEVTRDHLETAKENLRRHFSVMGNIERFDETVVLLNRKLGWTREVATTPRNVTKERKSASALPAAAVDAIRGWNELDAELHRFVDEWMDEAVAAEGPAFQEELARRRERASAVA